MAPDEMSLYVAQAGPRVRMMTTGAVDPRTGRPLLAVVRVDDHGRPIEEVRITEPAELAP